MRDFSGSRREAPHYPRARPFSRFGTVSACTDRQALSGLSWLSYSPPRFSSRGRRARHCPILCPRGHRNSPRRQRLNEPDGTFTRVASSFAKLWSEPPWGISTTPQVAPSQSPTLNRTTSLRRPPRYWLVALWHAERGVSLSPRIQRGRSSDRTTGFVRSAGGEAPLLRRASTNPDELLSKHPASLGSTPDADG